MLGSNWKIRPMEKRNQSPLIHGIYNVPNSLSSSTHHTSSNMFMNSSTLFIFETEGQKANVDLI